MRKYLFLLPFCMFCLLSRYVDAMTYSNGINESSWMVTSSVFECRLTHNVPFYGDAVFRRKAGEKSSFFLASQSSRLNHGKASLMFIPPLWKHNADVRDNGLVPVKKGLRPIYLNATHTERMLSELWEGMEVVFTRKTWYEAEDSANIAISSIGFRKVYKEYLACLSGLLPVNYEQIQRTAVFFATDKFELANRLQRNKLDNIVLYAKADPSVKEFYIDGHTDKFGSRKDNMILAENRAKAVSDYLVSKGLSKDAITVRWHGERYPASNKHNKNRRVTIRLERDGPMASPLTVKEG